ncbi:MAG: hypothetical protein ACKPKO_60245, partial [Candidatus Fonsibacter sp.]
HQSVKEEDGAGEGVTLWSRAGESDREAVILVDANMPTDKCVTRSGAAPAPQNTTQVPHLYCYMGTVLTDNRGETQSW